MKTRGFSLVELSIVLVILGLLVGGILAGKSLIRASELRSVTNDMMRYQTALFAFRDKYFYLPGDIPNATRFWPTAVANGNGDGILLESVSAWNHLSLASIIEGQYTGIAAFAVPLVPGDNVPASKISGAGYAWRNSQSYLTKTGLTLDIGRPNPNGVYQMTYAAFTTEDAWNIDTKMDDGVANTGRIRGHGDSGTGTGCTGFSYANTPGADYIKTSTGLLCALWYFQQN